MGNYDHNKTTPCAECMRALKWIPVLFIAAIIAWSYYAYVVQLCLLSIENLFEKIVFLIFYHLICILFFWSYWSTVFTPVGRVPSRWRIPEPEIERLFRAENQEQQKLILENCARHLPVTNRTQNGSVRFCEKCKIIKPDRAHHCSVCGTCILKMDHHCPWVNNCVNFKNYKFFVLFLGYALLYCLYVALTTLEYFILFWRGELSGGMGRFHILFLFFVSLMFAISLVSLFGYHVYLVLMNRTTLEAFRAPIFRVGGADKNGFNLGKSANFQEVFGDNWKMWLLPIFSSLGDGIEYKTQPQHQCSSTYDSMGDTQTHRLEDQPTDMLITLNEMSLNYSHDQQQQRQQPHYSASSAISPNGNSNERDNVDSVIINVNTEETTNQNSPTDQSNSRTGNVATTENVVINMPESESKNQLLPSQQQRQQQQLPQQRSANETIASNFKT